VWVSRRESVRSHYSLTLILHPSQSFRYWDWTKDADPPHRCASSHPDCISTHTLHSFCHSPVFDPHTGFGGDGVGGNGCVTDGPFTSYTISLGPGHALNNTCLTRGFDESMILYLTSKQVANTTIQPTFERFWMELEGNSPIIKPHNAGHRAIGGVLADTWSSPGGMAPFLCRTTEMLLTQVQTRYSIYITQTSTAFGGSGK